MAVLSERQYPERPQARWKRYKEIAASVLAAAAISCSSPSSPGPPLVQTQKETCFDSAKITDEVEHRLRMPERCWIGVTLMEGPEISELMQTAARDPKAADSVPAPREIRKMIRDTGEALSFLQTEGANEIPVLRYVKSVKEVDISYEQEVLLQFYRGRPNERSIGRFPPFAVEIDFGSSFDSAQEQAFAGKYFIGTNLLVFNPKGMLYNEVFKSQVAGHELVHYLSFLGHGGNYYYLGKDSRGTFIATERSMWMEEGFASVVAYRLFADPVEKVPYPHFTASAIVLEQVAGFDALADAALSGDMRRIQWRLEQEFEGTSFYSLSSGSIVLGPLFFPLMEQARNKRMVEFTDKIGQDPMIKKICDSPPKEFACPP